MLVKCTTASAERLPSSLNWWVGRDRTLDLAVDKTYIVYAITFAHSNLWYYIADESFVYYPVWNPSQLFKVVDGTLSSHWIFTDSGSEGPLLAFREWAEDPNFYERLTERADRELSVFSKYKSLIDEEAQARRTEPGSSQLG